jgi:integral membrane protein
MPLKYAAGMPMAVTIVGSIHGFLFLALVSMLVAAVKAIPISRRLALAGIFAAVVPFGPFVLDGKLGTLARERREA